VRSLVNILMTVATVIHFTLGCCLHPCHFGGCLEAVAIEVPASATCCHDHGVAASEADGMRCGRTEVGPATTLTAGRCGSCDGCQGCHCAATLASATSMFPWLPWALVAVTAIDGDAIAPRGFACGEILADPSFSPCPSRHGLFERFLV